MIEVLKKQWFVVLIALIFTSFAIYYIYDTNKGKLPGKSIDGKDVVATIGEQTITADDLYEGLDKTMSGSVASVYFSRYVADQSVETTDALKEEAKTNAEGYRSYVEQTYGTATDDMIAASLKQLNFDSLEDYFLIEAKKTKLYQDYYDKHLEELFQPLCEEKNGRVLSHILIKMDDAENPTEEELAKIEKVDAALAEGEDFGDVAEKYSDDSSASDGGLLGYSDDDTSYVTAFKETAATLKSVVRQRSHYGNYSFMDQITQKFCIHLLYIPHKAIVDVFYRAFHGTDYIHIRTSQSQCIDTTRLKSGYNILVYQPAVHHRHYFQRFGIRDTTPVYHLAFNAQLGSQFCGRTATSVYQDFVALDSCKVIQQLMEGSFFLHDFATHLYYC